MNSVDSLPHRRLLVVEDEAELLNVIKENLELAGIEVETASNCETAKKILAHSSSVVAVLSDIAMPGGSGLDLLRWIQGRGARTPVVFLTAHDTKENMKEAIQLGALDFIEKPFERARLVEVVERALEVGARVYRMLEGGMGLDDATTQHAMINRLRVMSTRKN